MIKKTSRLSGFYKLSAAERLKKVQDFAGLSAEETRAIARTGSLSIEQASGMVENVIGAIEIPVGIATNFLINGKDYLIPMATEEPSVIAACSNGARMARAKGGFFTSSSGPFMIGQIQAVNVADPWAARTAILSAGEEILEKANKLDPVLIEKGGGAREVEVRVIASRKGEMLITHLIVDCRDAMGANIVNLMAESLAPTIEKISGGKVYLRILSNYADKRLSRARMVVAKEALGGEDVVDGMIWGYECALADYHRATGHNKGFMNGVTAVVLATGNDTRAIESGAHAYAARFGRYQALPVWEKNKDGDLVGSVEMPVAIGMVGGATRSHPTAKACLNILGVESADELGQVLAAVGLSSKLAAERALATEGIIRGHMELNARNIAIMEGAQGEFIVKVADIMVAEGKVRADRARQILKELKLKSENK